MNTENTQLTRYVSVIAYSSVLAKVAVLVKLKGPEHLLGKVTVPGGKVEDTDQGMLFAARREFEEETGVKLTLKDMSHAGSKCGPGYHIDFIVANTVKIAHVKPQPGEIERVYLEDLAKFLAMPEEEAAQDIIEILYQALGD